MARHYDLLIIFSGYNQRAIIAFLRTLKMNNVTEYVIIAASPDDSIFSTEYKNDIIYTRTKKELDIEELKKILSYIRKKKKAETFLLVPSTEFLNRFVLRERKKLESMGCFSPLVNRELYELISDKESFKAICENSGIAIPERVNWPRKFSFPYVAKPKKYFSKSGKVFNPVLIKDNSSYEWFRKNCEKDDFIFERYLVGESYYLLYYIKENDTVFKLSQENYLQQPYGKSILCAEISDLHNSPVSLQFEKLFANLKFKGFIMIEVRHCDGQYYMIEANPRFWGPSQLFCDAELNLFECFLSEKKFMKEKEYPMEEIKKAKYFWGGGYMQTIGRGEKPEYFNMNEKDFVDHISEWFTWDVYNRQDTWKLFMRGL